MLLSLGHCTNGIWPSLSVSFHLLCELLRQAFQDSDFVAGKKSVPNSKITFVFLPALSVSLLFSYFLLFTLDVYTKAAVLYLIHAFARLIETSPVSLLALLCQVEHLLLHWSAAWAEEQGGQGRGVAGKDPIPGQVCWQSPCSDTVQWLQTHHSREAGLRSSQEVSLQVRVNDVAQTGSKGECQSLNTAHGPTGRGPDWAPCSSFHVV